MNRCTDGLGLSKVSSPCKYNYALPRHTNTDTDKFCNRAGQDKRGEEGHISVLEELAGSRLRRSCWAKYWFPTQHVISALHRQWCAPVLFKWLFTARQNIINAGSAIIHKCLNPYKRLQPSVNVSQVYHVTRERVPDYYQRFWYEKGLHCVLGFQYIYIYIYIYIYHTLYCLFYSARRGPVSGTLHGIMTLSKFVISRTPWSKVLVYHK